MTRPQYCEECPLYPRKCSGAACYYDYLDALAESKADNERKDGDEQQQDKRKHT